jgi:uncharacterized membrane protein YphA (DoxX/SURF4 family)
MFTPDRLSWKHSRWAGALHRLCLLLLCSAYLQGGLEKALDFDGALAEMTAFGLRPAGLLAVASIAIELAGSALVLVGRGRDVGALLLAAFTLVATLIANRFWEAQGMPRVMLTHAFFEHLGLAGALVLVAWNDRCERHAGRPSSPMAPRPG